MSTKPQPGAGNPTAKQINDIVSLARVPTPINLIARALNISQAAIEEWLDRGSGEEGTDLAKFTEEYYSAEALGQVLRLQQLSKHAETDATSAFKLFALEERRRRHPPL